MVRSGPITNMEEFDAFDKWWSNIDMKHYITPRDFMYHNVKQNFMEWLIAIPEGFRDTDKYEVFDFPGGLYAVGTAKDGDEQDMKRVKSIVSQWIKDSGCFEESTDENDSCERYTLAHVCTPKIFKEKMGYHLTDFFIPLVVKTFV